MRLTSNTSIQQVKSFIGQDDRDKLKESAQRRERLEKLAIMHSGKNVYVQLSGEEAYADIAGRNTHAGYTDRVVINIPIKTPDQVVTSYPDKEWDLLFQKTELYHELGHVLYTDWPSYEDVKYGNSNGDYGVDEDRHDLFHGYWNILEDAAIERILSKRFNIEKDLRVKNENLMRNVEKRPLVGMNRAIFYALAEYKHPLGRLDTLLDENNSDIEFIDEDDREVFVDEVLPIIEELAPEIISEDDPEERNIKIFEFYEEVMSYLESSNVPDFGEIEFFNAFNDAENEGDGSHGKNPSTGDEPDDIEPKQKEMGKYQDLDSQVDYSEEVDFDEKEDDFDREESITEWIRVIEKEYDVDTDMSLTVLDDTCRGTYSDDRRAEAERLSKPIAKDLGNRLRQQQKSKRQSKKKSGKVDAKRVHKTKQGKTNVFSNTSNPEPKDYACAIIIDRSGSMDDYANMVPEEEIASGAFGYALEELDIDCMQMSLCDNQVQLEKDFGEPMEDAKRKMFRGVNGGGTPMSDALGLARARLSSQGSHPFVIIITDGQPDHRERYRDQLDLCDFPVVGVYIRHNDNFTEHEMNEAAYYHRLEMREYTETMDGVRNLAKKIMF